MGYSRADWVGKPIIAIVNTWSDANQCQAHFKRRVEDVKRGALQPGGFPLELTAISLSKSVVKPTTMLYHNSLATLKTDAMTVNGRSLGDNNAGAEVYQDDVVHPPANPHQRPSAPTNLTLHQATDINVPVGCGDVGVWPGDVVVGMARAWLSFLRRSPTRWRPRAWS